jgi:hypothetical protein
MTIHDYMTNATLRERFSLPDDEYQATSALSPSLCEVIASFQRRKDRGAEMLGISLTGSDPNSTQGAAG